VLSKFILHAKKIDQKKRNTIYEQVKCGGDEDEHSNRNSASS
jgi:hypothetical protein